MPGAQDLLGGYAANTKNRVELARGVARFFIRTSRVSDLGHGGFLSVPRLTERTVRVRVTWPNGNAAPGAHVCVLYDNTKTYGALENANGIKETDRNGVAVTHVYGNSRVRVFAWQSVDDDKGKRTGTYYSHPAESAANKIPDELTFVLTSAKP